MSKSISFRSAVVAALAASRLAPCEDIDGSVWDENLRWLDRSGLALPLASLLHAQTAGTENYRGIPLPVQQALRQRLTDNAERMRVMLGQFGEACSALAASGTRYGCVKGFSLFPECFADIRERHQVDIDFLIDPRDAKKAQRAIESLGYRTQYSSDSGEMRFTQPWNRHMGVNAYLYQIPGPPAIEVHTRAWESEDGIVDFPSLPGFLDAVEPHQVDGVEFSRLLPAYQFVYLLLHIFRHLLGSWSRLLSLYEVFLFIKSRRQDSAFWAQVSGILSADRNLAAAAALVLALVERFFPTELSPSVIQLGSATLSPQSQVWVENYAQEWLFADPPGTKLSLLLQRQFFPDRQTWRRYLLRRLIPARKAHALSDEAGTKMKRSFSYSAENLGYQVSRIWYHVASDFRYLTARLQWAGLAEVPCASIACRSDESNA
jgi:hypothetical protein